MSGSASVVKLADVGSRMAAFRERKGVWHVWLAGRWGWGLSFRDATRDAMRGAYS